jgi:hypothetical protein
MAREQVCRGHEHAALAVAALRHLLRDPGGLQGVQAGGRGQPLYRAHLAPLHGRQRRHARAHGLPIQVHGARTTGADATAELGARELQHVAQRPEQGHFGCDLVALQGVIFAVDVQVHGVSLLCF